MVDNCCPSDRTDEDESKSEGHREIVRKRYAETARTSDSCCGPDSTDGYAGILGYDEDDLDIAPADTNLGLGCGNPGAIASLKPGETVVDLGSGPGFDCFLAARAVGAAGHVIGVDMTPEMVERARESAEDGGYENVDFRLGEIENIPIANGTADVVISNCVINLSPDKPRVYHEAFRILQPGGRVAISDIVKRGDLPRELQSDPDALAGCISGAATIEEHGEMLQDAGFTDIEISVDEGSDEVLETWSDEHDLSIYLASASIEARKPN